LKQATILSGWPKPAPQDRYQGRVEKPDIEPVAKRETVHTSNKGNHTNADDCKWALQINQTMRQDTTKQRQAKGATTINTTAHMTLTTQ
jgi:hypothetical protein